MNNRITPLDWISIALYSVALLTIALYHSRKLKKQDDIFLAGRSMHRWPIAISMYMALFSTNTFLGSTGWVNRPNGTIWICLQTFGIVAAVPLIVWLYPTLFSGCASPRPTSIWTCGSIIRCAASPPCFSWHRA